MQRAARFAANPATIPIRRQPTVVKQATAVWFEANPATIQLGSIYVVSKGVTLRPEAPPVPLRLSPVSAVFAAAVRVPSWFRPRVRGIPRQNSAQVILSYLSGRGTPRIRPTVKHIAELLVGSPQPTVRAAVRP
jgi:hypothetical protein